MYDFFLFFKKIDQPWGPKIDGFIMENTPKTTRRTYVEFCLSFTVIKKSSQNLQISAFTCNFFPRFFLFFKKWPTLKAKNRRFYHGKYPYNNSRDFLRVQFKLDTHQKIKSKSPNLSFQNCFLPALLVFFPDFFIFLKSDQPWRPKIDGLNIARNNREHIQRPESPPTRS